jgi:hypothetical protein
MPNAPDPYLCETFITDPTIPPNPDRFGLTDNVVETDGFAFDGDFNDAANTFRHHFMHNHGMHVETVVSRINDNAPATVLIRFSTENETR